MDILDVLRKQAGRFQCPNCGQSMADCGLDVVSRTDLETLVRVTCNHCQDARLIAVAFATEVEQPARPSVRDQPLSDAAPITADDVLDVRLSIDRHQGDLKSLIPQK